MVDMRVILVATLVAVAHCTAQFQSPVFSDLQAGHFDTKDVTHVYAHHGHDHTHDHSPDHHPTHPADDDGMPHPHNYIPIPIIGDCNGNFGPEPAKCVCNAAEIGFAQNTCEAGQACYSDGGCRDMQRVKCNVYEGTGGITRIMAMYNDAEIFADDNGFYDFSDAGPSASLSVMVDFENNRNGNPTGIVTCDDAYARVKCTADVGPYRSIDTGLRMGKQWGDELPVLSATCDVYDQTSNFPPSLEGRSFVYGSIVVQPYISASAASCSRASSEAQCNGMRAIGARCCYDYDSARCTYDEQCYYKDGPVAVTSRDFAMEIFGERVVSVRDERRAGYNANGNDDDSMGQDPLLGLARTLANLVN